MNLTKEQLQRAMLGGILVLVALYGYFSMLLGPLGDREKRALATMKDLEPKIKKANTQIVRTRAVQEGDPYAEAAAGVHAAMESKIPAGAAIVWLPERLSSFFARHGIRMIAKPESEANDPTLPNYRVATWAVSFPEVEFGTFASAIAALENEEGLAQIISFRIEAKPTNVESQSASLKFTTLVKK
jgi:hypothetical protein